MAGFEYGYIDPKDIDQKDLDILADAIEDYLSMFTDVMIIPKGIDKKNVEEALDISRKLVKKLRKGDKNVFKSFDDD